MQIRTKPKKWLMQGGLALFFCLLCLPCFAKDWLIKPNRPPQIISLTPKNRATFLAGDTIIISVKARDPDQDKLLYRYSIDNKILKDWTYLSIYSFKTTAKDLNKHIIKVEVRDPRGATDAKTTTICVFLRFPKPASQ